ncbi:MAG: hypothetical protein WHX52_11760 [Anaerolineae bacterium]
MQNLSLQIRILSADAARRHREALHPVATQRLPYDLKTDKPYQPNRWPRPLAQRLGRTFTQLGQWLKKHQTRPQPVYSQASYGEA